MLCMEFSLLFPLFHTLGLHIFSTLMQLSQGGLKQKVAMKDIYSNHRQRIHHPDTMNREMAHEAEKSGLYFSSDKLSGQPGTLNSSQISSSSLPVLPGDRRLLFPALHSASVALQSHTQVLQRPVGHIPPGITSIPAGEREEMQAKRDGQAVGREECRGAGKEWAIGNIQINPGRSWRAVLQKRQRGSSHTLHYVK